MRCQQFQDVVEELVRPGELTEAAMAEAQWHAAACAECAQRLATAAWVASSLRRVAEQFRQLPAPERVRQRLTSELVRRRAAQRAEFRWAQRLAVATAAGVVVLTCYWAATDVSSGRRGISAALPAVEHTVGSAAVSAPLVDQKTEYPEAVGKLTADASFVLLPTAEGLLPDESPLVVRVRLRRDALARLGYPVRPGPPGEFVQADLLVGPDGWPYAARVVH